MQNVISEQKNNKMMGKVVEAVVEGFDRWAECYFGRTKADAPDIDGKIFFSSEEKLAMGQFVKVRIDDTMDYDLIGEVI
jgi:ribosomal protein S12 methylthiotransferase